eukprot:758246-Pleurochrysis_carterae.AAC.5
MFVHVCWYFRYVRCYFISCRINTPPLAHATKRARTLSRGALDRPPPCVHVPGRDTRARTLASTRVVNW